MRSSPSFWLVSRKGSSVRVKVGVPEAPKAKGPLLPSVVQKELDQVDHPFYRDITIHLYLSYKAMVVVAAILIQAVYVYGHVTVQVLENVS